MRVLKPYGIALLATFAALVLRGAADPWLNDTYPLLTLFPAVGAAVYFGGVRPAIVTTALGYLGVNYWFIAPRGAFGFGSSGDFVALLAYISSCALIIAFGGALLSAKRRAEVAETTLTGQARELREADRRKDDFLAILAHELRNPLAPIRNSVTLLKVTGAADPHVVRARDIIDRQVAHMARLLDDLLDIGRITRNKLELRKQRIELVRIMDSALETSRPLIETSAHRLTVSLPKEPIYLDADPVRLSQAFANLLNNAAKYTDAGGHIELSAHCERKTLSVEVKDNGIGIAANELAHVFELFSQGSPSPHSAGGLGIGLSLVRGIVEMHGGSVTAASDGPGKGSTFTIRLPIAVRTIARPPSHTSDASPSTRSACRILVADDNRDAAQSLVAMLQVMGHEVRETHDGIEALSVATTFRPNVMLLDIGMPRLDGYETARRVRSEPWGKDILLVATTGWGQEDDKRRASEAGFNHHLTKPIDVDVLAKLLPHAEAARRHGNPSSLTAASSPADC